MTLAGWITLAIIAGAALLLVTERLRPDLTALLALLALTLTGVVTPDEAFSGFSRSAVITILALFILTHGLERTGVTRWLGHRLIRLAGGSETRLVVVVMLTAAGFSVVMNTIAAAAVLLPTTMVISRQQGLRPSRLLMPLAFGALLGGTATLLTTANIIVSTALSQAGLRPYGLFEFAPLGVPLIAAGTLLVVGLGPRLLPNRDVAGEVARMQRLRTELGRVYSLHELTSQVLIKPGSGLAGRTLDEGGWGQDLGLTVLGIQHQGRIHLAPGKDAQVAEGDILIVEGTPSADVLSRFGLRLSNGSELVESLASHDVPLFEVTLAPRSELEGRKLRDIHFRERYGLQVLAIWRQGSVIQENVADVPLRFGDAMLVQGPRDKADRLRLNPNFLLLEEAADLLPGRQGAIAAAILALTLGLAATGTLPIAVAAMIGACLMILTQCLTMENAYRAIEWRTIFLVAGMLPLSIALIKTGTSEYLGGLLHTLAGGLAPLSMAAVLLVAAIGLSVFLGGQTVAIVLAPVAIAAAQVAGADPRPMAMAVAIGCSLAFLTPLGHPASLLVMGPGGYRLRDYVRLGAPLTLASIVVVLAGLHWIWGL
jgi:di/tricarboxylate transporter